MPAGRFLSDAEIERLEGWPETIGPADLVRYFRLDDDDLLFVREQHSPAGQLGVALQLCALRWLGFVPSDLTAAPPDVLVALGGALDVSSRAIFDYAVRPQTRREHRPAVRDRARFMAASEETLTPVRDWLVERAMEHERPSLLFGEMCVELRRRGIERPAVNELMRIVGWARERAHELTYQRLMTQLNDETRAVLDSLLVTRDGRSQHAWLRQRPTSISSSAMRRELEKRALLLGVVGAERFDLSALVPNRRAWLAQTGRQQTNQALMRMAPERRYPVLMAFCVEALERCTDDALEVFDRALGAADRAAERKRDQAERSGRRDIQTTVRRFIDLCQLVLEAHDSDADVMRLVQRRIGIETLRDDLQRALGVARPHATGHLAELIGDHGAAGRKLLAGVIDSLELRVSGTDEDQLLAAVALIRRIADEKLRWLPGFSPTAFIDPQWRAQIVDSSRGRLDRGGYELCVAYELRSALRAGRVWVPGSRRHADPASLMLPRERWEQIKSEFTDAVELPISGQERLDSSPETKASFYTGSSASGTRPRRHRSLTVRSTSISTSPRKAVCAH